MNMAVRPSLVGHADLDSSSTSMSSVIAFELCGLIVKNGGKMDLGNAVGQLSSTSKQFVLCVGALNFISTFPDLFNFIKEGKSKSKVIVQATMPIKFCEDVKAKTGCRNSQCTKLHLCPHFIKNDSCTFGNKCRRSHDIRDPHTMRILKRFNLVFVGTKTLLEILRRIIDETEIERTASALTVPDVCKFYNNEGGCTKGDNCPFLHVCMHFVDGDCKFGEGCKRDHNFKSKHNRTVLAEYNLLNLKDRNILSNIKSVRKTRSDSMSSDTDLREKTNVAAVDPPRLPPVPEICNFYNSAQTCSRKETCPFLHVCKYFVNGDCKFGTNCKRSHSFSISQNRKILENLNMAHLSDSAILDWLQSKQPNKKSSTNSSTDLSSVSQQNPTNCKVITTSGTCTREHDDQDEICGYHLKGKCNYGDRCIRKHTDFPYLWQYQFCAGKSQLQSCNWHDFSSDLNEKIEASYSNAQKAQCSVRIVGEKFKISFTNSGKMTAEPAVGAVDDMKVEIRRLTTSSSAVAPPGHLFSTTWKWYWKDEFGKWQSYDSASDRHLPSNTTSDVLEKKYLSGEVVHKFSTTKHSYTMYFGSWFQVNEKFMTIREVRRRPKLITKDIMKSIIGAKAVTGRGSQKCDAIIPSHWSKIPSGDDYSLELLQSISDEFKKTEAKFCETMRGHRIIKIERVQNIGLWTDFIQKRQKLSKKSGNTPEERQLFHGTSPAIVEAICQQGFDWRVCGKHGTAFGKGTYFAKAADYSHKYTRSSSTSHHQVKTMFLSRVIVGSYTKGESDMVKPPPKDPSKPYGVLYDSCVNDTVQPTIFVVFENGQSYPEFLISYL